MIVQALPQFSGQRVKVNYNGKSVELKFDSACKTDVNNELGKFLLDVHSSFIFDPNKVEEEVKTVDQKASGEVIDRINRELSSVKEELDQVKSQKKEVENDCQAWKNKVIEQEIEVEGYKKSLEEEKIATKKTIDDCDFKVSLFELTDAKLKNLCIDSNLPKEEWENLLSNKVKLINYIISKQ